MLVRREGDALVVVLQEDHAHFAGELAAALRDSPTPRAAFISATRTHDNGWRESDSAPLLNERDGAPHSYRTVPDKEYLDVWARGIDRAVALDPLVGLLVSIHGARFFGRKRSEAARAFTTARRAEQDALLRALGLGGSWDDLPGAVDEAAGWLSALDAVSLFALGEWEEPLELDVAGQPFTLRRFDSTRTTMEPFPFRSPVRFDVPARTMPGAPFKDEAALRQAFAAAPRVRLAGELTAP